MAFGGIANRNMQIIQVMIFVTHWIRNTGNISAENIEYLDQQANGVDLAPPVKRQKTE